MIAIAVFTLALLFSSCAGDESAREEAEQQARETRRHFVPYTPRNGVEGGNYNRSQELYDDPNTILFCTILPASPTIKAITVPIAGKLTSSSVSAFRSEDGNGYEKESVDGLYHGSPPPYRYGFTPSDNYVEFWGGDQGFCSSVPTEIQQESLQIDVAGNLDHAARQAEKALAEGDRRAAQKILSEGVK